VKPRFQPFAGAATAHHTDDSSACDDEDDRTDEERIEGLRRLKADLAIVRSPELTALATQLYEHVVDAIDFDALSVLEQLLWGLLDRMGLGAADDELGLSRWLISRALITAAHDPSTSMSDVPFGITKAEERAAKFDEACPFCQYEAEHPRQDEGDGEHDHGGDECELCDDMAREWRAKHADQLRRAGLVPGKAVSHGSHS